MKRPLVIIGGPTACGKTAMSILLAKKIGGEIISADSMQVYRYMDIGTAKVTLEEAEGIPHYLIDELDPDEPYHVMIFQKKAKAYMQQIWERGNIPIVVGGTGFYINALLYDNTFTETDGDSEFRLACYRQAEENGAESLYQKLLEVDPEYAATTHANNVKRVTRALEYHHFTGEKFSKHNAEQKQKESPYQAAVILLTMERQQLYQRIEQRVDEMMKNGLLEEVKGLLERGYDGSLVSMQGLGYKEFLPYFDGKISLEEAVAELKTGTRRFAKRQLTWFRKQIEGHWIDLSLTEPETALVEMLEYIQSKGILIDGQPKEA